MKRFVMWAVVALAVVCAVPEVATACHGSGAGGRARAAGRVVLRPFARLRGGC